MRISKYMFVPVLFAMSVLTFVGTAQQHPVGDDLKPPKQYERLYAATVVDDGVPTRERKLYIGDYDYSDIKGTGGFSGSFDILVTALSLDVRPGYQAIICGPIGKKSFCIPHLPGQHKIEIFPNVEKIIISKIRRDDEVVLWYNTFPPTGRPVASVYRLNTSYTMATPYSSPGKTWIPDGLWLRLCKSRTPGNRQCQTFTSDTGAIKGDFEVVQIGKGTPPREPVRVTLPKPETKPLQKTTLKVKTNQLH